ncbi:hypothetical protein [Albibacterium profundi]|uniref:DUF304 domain-containing protein n=1 Tax=Albibacterium profundi TaxID=3134906 RepID=A0ABV5CDT8_9SPHI
MRTERLKFYPGLTAILPIVLILGCVAVFTRNLYYHFGWLDTSINLFENGSNNIDPLFTTAVFVLFIIMGLIEEVYKKFLYIKIVSNDEIIIYRFFKKHILSRDEIQAIKVDKLFSLGALPNEVIRISTGKKRFMISKLYIRRYNRLKKHLTSHFDVKIL